MDQRLLSIFEMIYESGIYYLIKIKLKNVIMRRNITYGTSHIALVFLFVFALH